MRRDVGSRIVKNSAFNFLRTILTVPLMLVITPYIISHLGREEFGVWALVGVISSYAQLSDFGITESLIKFIAEYEAHGDDDRLNRLINTAFTLYLFLGMISCGLLLLLLPYVVSDILNIPPLLRDKALLVFSGGIILFFINMLMGVFGSVIIGFQRMGYSNLISLLSTLLMTAGVFIFLYNGFGLTGLICNNAIVTSFVVVANGIVAWRLFPPLRINPFRYFSRGVVRQIFGFSWKVQLTNMTQLMIFQIDRILLSHFLGLQAVAHYEVANRIASQARGFIASLFSPMTPAASVLQAGNEEERVAGLYRRSFRYMAIIAIPVSTLIIMLAHPFIVTWLGAGYDTSAYTLQLLMLAYLASLLTGPGSMILSGINKPQLGMKSSILAGFLNVALCLVLVRTVGYYGIVIGIFVSIVVSGLYFIRLVHGEIGGLEWRLYRQCLPRPMIASICPALAILGINLIHPIRGYPTLVLIAGCYCLAVYFMVFKGNYLDEFDRSLLTRFLPVKWR